MAALKTEKGQRERLDEEFSTAQMSVANVAPDKALPDTW